MQYQFSENARSAAHYLADTIAAKLNEGRAVLWLVSGGSGGKVTIEVAKLLEGVPLDKLFVTLSDERYGPVGHADENWQILLDDGLSLPGATLYRPLIGAFREDTTRAFGQWLEGVVQSVDYTIGLFGIGSDGHTAGIKPNTVAVDVADIVSDFAGEDFERITITPAFIPYVDEAVLQAFGEDKHHVIQQLLHDSVDVHVQPAQILKEISKLTVYSDYKEAK